jgi:hypothetical protein
MSTPYNNLFLSFLGKITDPFYSEATIMDAEADMIVLKNSAIIEFEYPREDIRDFDDEAKVFNQDLSLDTIEIFANLMKLKWIDRQVNNKNVIKQKFTDRDFKMTSQAEHLNQLLKLKQDTLDECERLKSKYSFVKNRKSNFSGLAGDK